MNFSTLYKKTSTGKIQEWTISVTPHFEMGLISTVYGQVDGKKQVAEEYITEGKNAGRSNATTAIEQAYSEAQSQWEQKKKKGYVENIEDAEAGEVDKTMIAGGIAPMLAHTYEKQGHKIKYPALMQPKLDGHRCVAIVKDGKASLWSRTQKRITSMVHIERELEALFPTGEIALDGELYNHGYRDKFEKLTSKIRNEKPTPGSEVVQYWIYDIVADWIPQGERVEKLLDIEVQAKDQDLRSIVVLATFEVESEEAMIETFGVFLNQGYEGGILRNKNAKYANKRSYDLQKVKVFQDAEYPVVAIEEGRGKMAGLAMFVCDAGNGKTFRVKMVGALDSLKTYFDNPDPWIGKMLTVKFQKFSAEGMPIFPVAMRFREDV